MDATIGEPKGAASILVVDDNRVSGLKLAKAAVALGHKADIVGSGEEALRTLRETRSDLVLLDILMPGMDGFSVLKALNADQDLRDIPVIVISALDHEIESVARAIKMGAEDFLSKDFEPAILRARIDATLLRKRLRDRELADFRDIEQLTHAASVIEAGAFRPEDLDVDSVADRTDPLGRFAYVMRDLAQQIYDRELRLDVAIRTLRGTLLVIVAGGVFGITPALGRLASEASVPPLGFVFWANVVAAVTCLSYSMLRSGVPDFRVRDLGFLCLWAIILGCLYQLLTLVIAAHVQASMIALVGSTRGFMVFLLAAVLGLEKLRLRRFLGLGIGFVAVMFILFLQGETVQNGEFRWLAAALVLPLCLSFHTLLMTWRPQRVDAAATVGAMMALSALFIAPFAISRDALFLPSPFLGQREVLILVVGVSTAVALVLALELVSAAGAVFASQMAYSQTIAGIFWGMIILGESLSSIAWVALATVVLGFWLVEPRRAGGDFRITLSLGD